MATEGELRRLRAPYSVFSFRGVRVCGVDSSLAPWLIFCAGPTVAGLSHRRSAHVVTSALRFVKASQELDQLVAILDCHCVSLVTSKSGVGKDLIWARMDIFKDRPFGKRFDSLPTLDSNEKLHIGVEVI